MFEEERWSMYLPEGHEANDSMSDPTLVPRDPIPPIMNMKSF